MDRALAYATLELSAEATPEEVRTAYRRRAFATHPDRAGGDVAAFRAVSEAYRALSDPALPGAPEPGPAAGPDGSARVPPTDAAKVLFEYLSDLASDMILNGATPEVVVAFLAGEGCPASVARALERELRDRVQPEPNDPGAAPRPPEPSAAQRSARSSPRWLPVAVGVAAVAACVAGAWPLAKRAFANLPAAAPPAAAAVVVAPPVPATPQAPPPPPSAPAPARPPRSAPARPHAQPAPRPATRDRRTASLSPTSGELDAEREALEADQRRFAAEAAELDAESARIDAAEAALASAPDPRRAASLASAKAAYNARFERARRMEKDLQRRVRDLNGKITAYNERVRAGR
ncbi:J domain-containing protein [Anaeromyxobacter diazotrophicus]|uniref:J domain-containing protein n=1 Tax=Anaeromyxobacter diazotrophicus TaxID=2590199 RepID=A0A7I9VJF9_9BACT|nr:J domain-containing protein [Anaeromyxobacter diazotrophicus]GEJ56556.1 hypothetical protein AMYX_12970 [Anaeromyxobacter diazotrophicus]